MTRKLILASVAALAICSAAQAKEVVPTLDITVQHNDYQFTTSDGALHTISPDDPNVQIVVYPDGDIEMLRYDTANSGKRVVVGYHKYDGRWMTTRFCWELNSAAWTCRDRNELDPSTLPVLDAGAYIGPEY